MCLQLSVAVVAVAIISTTSRLVVTGDFVKDDIDVEKWVSKRYLFDTSPSDYESVRKSIMDGSLGNEEAEGFPLSRRKNPPVVLSRSRVEVGIGVLKSPIIHYPPKFLTKKLQYLQALQERQKKKNNP